MSSQANKLNNIKMALHVKSTVYNDVKKQKKKHKNRRESIRRQNNPNIVLGGWYLRVSGTVHEQKKLEDHGYNNFAVPNHENKQVKYSF